MIDHRTGCCSAALNWATMATTTTTTTTKERKKERKKEIRADTHLQEGGEAFGGLGVVAAQTTAQGCRVF